MNSKRKRLGKCQKREQWGSTKWIMAERVRPESVAGECDRRADRPQGNSENGMRSNRWEPQNAKRIKVLGFKRFEALGFKVFRFKRLIEGSEFFLEPSGEHIKWTLFDGLSLILARSKSGLSCCNSPLLRICTEGLYTSDVQDDCCQQSQFVHIFSEPDPLRLPEIADYRWPHLALQNLVNPTKRFRDVRWTRRFIER